MAKTAKSNGIEEELRKQGVKREVFEGRSAEMKKDSPWLASEDIEGFGDVEVEIEGVFRNNNVKTEGGKVENNVYTIKFVGKKKEMWLNNINRQRIRNMYGVNVKDWKGKKIKLYVDDKVRAIGGGYTKGIRVREEKK